MSPQRDEGSSGTPEVPAGLSEALRGSKPAPTTSKRTDERVLAAAAERFDELAEPATAPAPVRGPRPLHLVRWSAAAAVLLVFLWIANRGRGGDVGLDLDGSGRVDVLDAFRLARSLRDGTTDGLHDVDGDGRVDERDVAALMGEAVRL